MTGGYSPRHLCCPWCAFTALDRQRNSLMTSWVQRSQPASVSFYPSWPNFHTPVVIQPSLDNQQRLVLLRLYQFTFLLTILALVNIRRESIGWYLQPRFITGALVFSHFENDVKPPSGNLVFSSRLAQELSKKMDYWKFYTEFLKRRDTRISK